MIMNKELSETVAAIKTQVKSWEGALLGENMTETRKARIEGKITGLEDALKTIWKTTGWK